jgi:hypothetical protein
LKIFIDDSGDFGWAPPGASLFCAVTVSDRTLDGISSNVSTWKSRQPGYDPDVEAKGKDLLQFQQASFAQSIVLQSTGLRLTLAGTKTNLFKRELMEQFISDSAGVLRATARWAETNDKPLLKDHFRGMARWIEQRSPENILWLYTLGNVIDLALQHGIVMFADEEHDCEFENIEILIDQSFITRPKHDDFWREWLRNFLFIKSEKNPMITIKEWSERDHPFNRKYGRQKGIIDWSDLFRNHMHFVNSHEVTGVQIADICANICYRHYSGNRKYRPYRLLRSRTSGKYNTEMHWGVFNESSLRTDAPENHVFPYSNEDLEAHRRAQQNQEVE